MRTYRTWSSLTGDPVAEVARFEPDAVFCSEDASPYAVRRERRLAERFDLRLHPRITVAPFGELKRYRVFEIAWRDFYAQLLRAEPDRFRLGRPRGGDDRFEAWCEARTGVPLVDVGMRQLAEEGWMPNRVRMVCAQSSTRSGSTGGSARLTSRSC